MSARQVVSIMTDDWTRSLGWSKTFIGSGQSVAPVMVAIMAPVAGNLADRYGARLTLALLLFVSAGLPIFAIYPTAGLYIAGYGLVGGIGFATANMHVISTAIARSSENSVASRLGSRRRVLPPDIHHRPLVTAGLPM